MAKKQIEANINLLPQEEFEGTTLGRTLKWLLTTFRYIVIGTEMIVMVAFLSRFWFDAKSADLINSINQKKAIISSYSTFEKDFRNVQSKLTLYNNYSSDSQKISPIIEKISSLVPQDITLTSILINNTKIEMTAQTQNEKSAANFIKSLNTSDNLSNAAVTSIEAKSGNPTITFTIAATIKERGINAE